ncbi:outer membrane lipoprotein-sorting protein [Kordiimonas lacus]|uniref:SSD domain-containing protein n=1 Tax=Kordiimonas lacus TaxID=637679 RepID=A0A1G6SYQ4_9PROT|nr:outer membrane lipoprotein-sorting protein [Kordiimonas lacus]SDD21357.1 hypothetical protein SAMN04488071_0024 [Kordiimonas lacus]
MEFSEKSIQEFERKISEAFDMPRAYFTFVTEFPRRVIALGLVFILVAGAFIPSLVKDTTIDAFIDPENVAIQYRDKVKDLFGLKDPIIVAIAGPDENAAYHPSTLTAVRELTEALSGMDNIDPEKVMSLSTEMSIRGTSTDLFVDPLIPDGPVTDESARLTLERVSAMPLYHGNLVTNDGSATLIVAEVIDQHISGKTYEAVLKYVGGLAPANYELHVAGGGAVDGYLSAYIDKDSRQTLPFTLAVIVLMLFLAFRTPRSVGLPLLVIVGTAVGTIGTMAAVGVPYYAITSALPIILVGISVADSIHLLTYYYSEQKAHPEQNSRELVIGACTQVWRPLVMTSVTTMIGFIGIAATAIMPPMKWFAVFASLGVLIAIVLTLTVLPAALSLCRPLPCKAIADDAKGGFVAGCLAHVNHFSIRHPYLVCAAAALTIVLGLFGASSLEVERETVHNFREGEPIREADALINARFNGTTYLDVIIETPEEGGLYEPENLKRVEALQGYLESLPHIKGSVSIVDYLKQLNKSLNAGDEAYYRVPDNRNLVEQMFLVHSATGDPTDFEEEVDPAFQTALLRANLNTSLYSDVSKTVIAAEDYLAKNFADDSIKATLSGRAALDHHWLSPLRESHFMSLGVSIVLIWAAAVLLFRSVVAGTITLVPVVVAILMIYAVMGAMGIWLEPATSMFAPIAIGVGVDFSIHTVEKIRYYTRKQGLDLKDAMDRIAFKSGRALFFNFASIFLAFGVLLFSELPTLNRFGGLTTVALGSAYVMALVVLPAIVAALSEERVFRPVTRRMMATATSLLVIAVSAVMIMTEEAGAQETPEGRALAERIAARPEPDNVDQTIEMVLTDRKGRTTERTARMLRKIGEDQRRSIIAFSTPSSIKDTAFMTHDFNEAATSDNQWLYLPALRRSRRISASDRGDYFLGTDFTYEDIKDSTKFSLTDYQFQMDGAESVEGKQFPVLLLTPVSGDVAKELGYSKVRVVVDAENAFPIRADYWDVAGNRLKTIMLDDRILLDGFWTVQTITAENHKTGHSTRFNISDIDYGVQLQLSAFTERKLRAGF